MVTVSVKRLLERKDKVNTVKEELLRKLASKGACIGIVGLGYVGLPLAIRFAQERFRVLGFDINVA